MAISKFRSYNPVWLFSDLVGNLLDDQYWVFFLQNTIPYQPTSVYNDDQGTVILPNPLQVQANGTLTPNLFFTPDVAMRIEIRRGNTQQDELIYLIEDYLPEGAGGSPTPSFQINADNQITNPQFVLVDFSANTVISAAGTYVIAPGWSLVLSGTGTATLNQAALTSTQNPPTNAPYALDVALTGWDTAVLRQRFNQNGILWREKYVAAQLTGRLRSGASGDITARLRTSSNETIPLFTGEVGAAFSVLSGVGEPFNFINTDIPPGAYVDLEMQLENSHYEITSVQAVPTSAAVESLDYEQETVERQIDHTYHTAYPIVPVGTIIDFGGFGTPSHYLNCDFATYDRLIYSQLFRAITTTATVALTSTVNTFTVADGSIYRIGMGVEGTGIPAATTISNISGTTITISSAATTTANSLLRFFAAGKTFSETVNLTISNPNFTVASAANYVIGMRLTGTNIPAGTVILNIVGTTVTMSQNATATDPSLVTFYSAANGDGTETFNVYDLRDYVIAGMGGSLFGAGNNGLGERGGSSTHHIDAQELPEHTHTVNQLSGAGATGNRLSTGGGAATTGPNVTAHNAMTIVQQTALMRKLIRYE